MNIRNAQIQLPKLLDLCQSEAVIIEKSRKPYAVIISYDRYDELMTALEDIEDLAALADVEADIELHSAIPWEEVKRDLGI